MTARHQPIVVNRAPVLTLWGAVVAERLGFDPDAALTLGRALAGRTAQAKGRHLGIFRPPGDGGAGSSRKSGLGEDFWVDLAETRIPAARTAAGVRAVVKDQPIDPETVRSYLEKAFGGELKAVRTAMERLAASIASEELSARAFSLYQQFRPQVARGQTGWGQKGEMSVEKILDLIED